MAGSNLFASKNLKEHYWRGAVGIPAYYLALKVLALPTIYSLFGAVGLAAFGLYALRGCPVCWSIGLFNTAQNKVCAIPSKNQK